MRRALLIDRAFRRLPITNLLTQMSYEMDCSDDGRQQIGTDHHLREHPRGVMR